VLAAVPATLAAAVAFVLPNPESLAIFLGTLGFGIGVGAGSGVAIYIERVGKAKVRAFQEYDRAFKASNLAARQQAERLRDEMIVKVQANSDEIHQLKAELAEKTHAAEAALMTLAEQSLKILTDYGYVHPGAGEAGEHAPQQAPDADRRG
jgi:hypothetical protein